MLFNSLDFTIFLPIVFLIYWVLLKKKVRAQNVLLMLASYVFYGWWEWKFLSLIIFSTIVDYFVGVGLGKSENERHRKLLLWTSICINLGFLGVFKYYNFFIENFTNAFSFFGQPINANSLNIILPVGISFYTFQTLSYSIDCYKRKLKPTTDFVAFSAYVSFFPQLVAGPIERATNLLPQFSKERNFSYAQSVDGLRQILWGLFMKVVIADNCAELANKIFNNSDSYSGSTLVLGALFFTFQIYGDFAGYSNIAIGTARLFGFDLMKNFAFPYFSRDIAEFWRRWHISLSTWFRDYLYIPLGGSKGGMGMKIRNTFIIFIVSGFWHGANWTFIIWGALNAVYFLPLLLTNNNRNHLEIVASSSKLPSLKEGMQMLLTFGLTVIAWVFFRAENLSHAMHYLSEIFSASLFTMPSTSILRNGTLTILLVLLFLLLEWNGRKDAYAIEKLGLSWNKGFRLSLYYAFILAIFWFGGKEQQFIYFQF